MLYGVGACTCTTLLLSERHRWCIDGFYSMNPGDGPDGGSSEVKADLEDAKRNSEYL